MAQKQPTLPQIHSLRLMAFALIVIGGFIDAYTFVQRGRVLAAGQTGNIVFLSVDIADHNLAGVMTKIAAIIMFSIGVALVTIIKYRHHTHYWRVSTLIPEILACTIIGFLPTSVPNVIIVPTLAFVMAMQTTAFSEIEGHAYNNVFSTGNLKKAMISITTFSQTHQRQTLTTAIIYFELVIGFASGAIFSTLLQKLWGIRTIWIAAGLLVVITSYYIWAIYRRNQRYL